MPIPVLLLLLLACANRTGNSNWPFGNEKLLTTTSSHLLSHPLIDPTIILIMLLQVQEYEEEIDSSAVLIRHNRGFTSVVRSAAAAASTASSFSDCDPLRYTEEDTLRAMDPDMLYGVSERVSVAGADPPVAAAASPLQMNESEESEDKEVKSAAIGDELMRSQQPETCLPQK